MLSEDLLSFELYQLMNAWLSCMLLGSLKRPLSLEGPVLTPNGEKCFAFMMINNSNMLNEGMLHCVRRCLHVLHAARRPQAASES